MEFLILGGGGGGGGGNAPRELTLRLNRLYIYQPQVIPNFPTYGVTVCIYTSTQGHIMFVACPPYPAVFL